MLNKAHMGPLAAKPRFWKSTLRVEYPPRPAWANGREAHFAATKSQPEPKRYNSGMRRFAWRYVLPTVQLTVFVVSIGVGCRYVNYWLASYSHPQAADGFDLRWIDGPPTALEQLAYGLSFPATAFAEVLSGIVAPILPSLNQSGFNIEMARHGLAAIVLVPFWFAIGWCIDRGIVLRRPRSGPVLGAVVVAFVLCIGLAVSAILSFFLFGRSWIDFALIRLFIIAWAVTGIIALRRVVLPPPLPHSR